MTWFVGALFLGLVWLGFSAAVIMPTNSRRQHGRHGSERSNGDNDWDYMLFVQRWPASECVDGHVTSGRNTQACSFPPEMAPNAWLMHGIWPTKAGTEGPVDCNKTATWDATLVDPLLDDLKEYWSNLEANTRVDSFWEHEWSKHGTCAQTLPALSGEFNFFNQALQLQQKTYNFYEALASQQILPDASRNYSHDQFAAALSTVYASTVEVWCTFSHDTKKHYVAEIRLCLDKSLQLMDCPTSSRKPGSVEGTDSCPKTGNLVYAPVDQSSGGSSSGTASRRSRHGSRNRSRSESRS